MVFPSVPLYLDPPSWNQQHLHQPIISGGGGNNSTDHAPLPPCPVDGGPSAPPPRTNSMAERARMAKMPQPEQALKCPRCDSTNTKFCYFNNYSLTQPRHFCKACRRYWTRGGALRNVPVGGGCRRNKRSSGSNKSSSSKSSAADRPSSSTATCSSVPALPLPPQMPFLHHPMLDYSSSGGGGTTYLGLGFHGMQQMEAVDNDHYQGVEQWRPTLNQIHHFPFLGGLEQPQLHPAPLPTTTVSGLYPFDGSQDPGKATGSELASQLASVKMEENPRERELNLARRYLGAAPRNDQFWDGGIGAAAGSSSTGGGGGGGGWMTHLSGFNSSSSTGNLL